MGNWSLGSVSERVWNYVDNIPVAISGLPMMEIADRKRRFVEEYTGQSIGSTGIDLKWQGILVNLTVAEVMNVMNIQGADVSSISLGDLSVNKGAGGSADVVAKSFQEMAMKELNSFGRVSRNYRSYG